MITYHLDPHRMDHFELVRQPNLFYLFILLYRLRSQDEFHLDHIRLSSCGYELSVNQVLLIKFYTLGILLLDSQLLDCQKVGILHSLMLPKQII